MAISDIPVKMYGTDVGTAAINDDGSVITHINANQFGVDWLAQFEAGEYTSLTLQPSGVPMVPQPPAETP